MLLHNWEWRGMAFKTCLFHASVQLMKQVK
ncbi:MAG: hypothetical protein JWQ79_395 [Mucilaginibacter sp.]|nr:hypothetical protein [Mucilaginibacter sp.]